MFVASCVATPKDKAKYSYRYMDRTSQHMIAPFFEGYKFC